jgi:hypothetical protein
MNTEDEDNPTTTNDTTPRPLGFWLRVVDERITDEFRTAFDGEHVSRRDWMLLNALSGEHPDHHPGIADRPGRPARAGKRLHRLADLGWAEEQGDGTWQLTDDGRAAKARLGEKVDGIRSRVAGAVPPEDFATTLASLEAIARELGWDETQRPSRRGRFGRPRGFGPGFRHGFGPNLHRGFEPGEHPHHGSHGHHGHHNHEDEGCRGHRGRHGQAPATMEW